MNVTPSAQRVALLWSYNPEAASFRHRMRPLVAALEHEGWRCTIEHFPHGRSFRRILERRRQVAEADVLVLAKLKLRLGEHLLLRRFGRRFVLDIDDAVVVSKPQRLDQPPGRSLLSRWKFALTCRLSDVVVGGSAYLAQLAAPYSRRVEVVPTAVDLATYPEAPPPSRRGHTLVWIGRPTNLMYLELIRPVLRSLAGEFPDLRLRVVCSHFPDWPELPVERVQWSSQNEADALATAGIGIMPLTDDDWSRGKCAFKLLQYMAAWLPTVASPVGANRDVVTHGTTGFLAGDSDGWTHALRELLAQPELRDRLGRAGHARVAAHYDRPAVVHRYAGLITALVETAGNAAL